MRFLIPTRRKGAGFASYNQVFVQRWESYLRQEIAGAVLRRVPYLLFACAWLWRRLMVRTVFVAVSGSLGKTTAKEILAEILAGAAPTYRTWRNQNARTSVALNVLRVRPWHRFAVLEVEAGSPGSMDWPARVVAPDLTVMLCIAATHTTAYEDLDAHAREKRKIVRQTRTKGKLVLNADDPRTASMASEFSGQVLYFSTGASPVGDSANPTELPDVVGAVLPRGWPQRLSLRVQSNRWLPAGGVVLRTQLVGAHWANSVLGAFTAATALGVDPAKAAARIESAPPFPGRMFPVETPRGVVFLRDDYNASTTVLDASLEVLRAATATRRILVITDFSDFGANRRQRLKFLASRLAESADALVLVGNDAQFGARRAIEADLKPELVHAFRSLKDASEFLAVFAGPGDLVLVKGRTTDHAARLVLSQFAPIDCWKEYCPKRMLCDICWELGSSQPKLLSIKPLAPPAIMDMAG